MVQSFLRKTFRGLFLQDLLVGYPGVLDTSLICLHNRASSVLQSVRACSLVVGFVGEPRHMILSVEKGDREREQLSPLWLEVTRINLKV